MQDSTLNWSDFEALIGESSQPRPPFSPARLALLLAVQRAGGIVAAAGVENISPSAMSQQIKALEKEVGTPVLLRTATGSVLTPAGRVLAEAAERIETEMLSAWREVAALDDATPSGLVRVGAFSSAIRALLLPLLPILSASHPGLSLIIEETEERTGLARLRRGELDLMLLERDGQATPPPRYMTDTMVLDEAWLVVVPPGRTTPTTLRDVADAPWINLNPDTAGAQALDRLSRQLGLEITTGHVGYDYDVVLAMVGQGMGYALLPEMAVLSGHVPEGVTVARLPGLGVRQLFARHRATRAEPSAATSAVLSQLLSFASSLELGT